MLLAFTWLNKKCFFYGDDKFEKGLEFQQVAHHCLWCSVQFGLAEFVKILQPKLFKRCSDVLWLKLLENILNFIHCPWIASFLFHLIFQKSHEIRTNGRVNQDISVKSRVIITLKNFDVSDFGEVPKRVNVVEKDFDVNFVFEAFDNVDYVINLVSNGDHVKEVDKHSSGVANSVLNLISKFLFKFGPEEGDGNVGILSQEVSAVVGVFQELKISKKSTDLSYSRLEQFRTWVYWASVKKDDLKPRMMPSA